MAEVLQGLQPARKPIPGGMSWTQLPTRSPERTVPTKSEPAAFEASCQPEPADAQHEKG